MVERSINRMVGATSAYTASGIPGSVLGEYEAFLILSSGLQLSMSNHKSSQASQSPSTTPKTWDFCTDAGKAQRRKKKVNLICTVLAD